MKLYFKTLVVFLGSIIILTTSCRKVIFNCIRGNNIMVSDLRTISEFSSISSAGNFYVYVSSDSTYSLEVNAEENIIPYINTYVKNNTLHLEVQDERCIRENQVIKIYIKTPEVEEVNLLGSGIIECNNVTGNSFFVNLLGSGDIYADLNADFVESNIIGSGEIRFTGFTDRSEINIAGSGNLSALQLEQNKCFVNITGSGDVYVNVNDLLDGKIIGTGNIYYLGNPAVNVSILGTGRVYIY